MLHDLFQEREAKKYDNPIPSRECILAYIGQRKQPIRRDELAQALLIHGKKNIDALKRRLRAMERDGQLVFTRRQGYAIPETLNLLEGKVIGHRDGFGFLRVEGQKNDLYLSVAQMQLCLHGDIILAQGMEADRKGRREACVIRVITPRHTHIVGRYFRNAQKDYVIPDDNRLRFEILVRDQSVLCRCSGDVVVVELTQRPTYRNQAIGKIIEVLGSNIDTTMAINIALRTHNIPYIWSKTIQQTNTLLHTEVPEHAKNNRVDLRHLPFVTIDGEDACDLDDAVFCTRIKKGGWRLWVAIADVSYYVRPGTIVDAEALNRGTSVYFPSQVVPMLPEILSTTLCSLNSKVDRLCMVCEMCISSNGELVSYKHYEAVINSCAQLTYNTVGNVINGDKELRQYYEALTPHLDELYYMYLALEKSREKRGGIMFDTVEAKFIFNVNQRIERIEQMVRNHAHKIIEECMILANIAAARFVEKHREPALFRDHDRPIDDNVKSFRLVLHELGLTLLGGDQPRPLDYSALLKQISGRPDHDMIQTMLLRSLKQAVYDLENRGHFGLALSSYTHFTSPIRRYPDLLLHRTIKYLLAKETIKEGSENLDTSTGGYHYTISQMLQFGQHCSMAERRADEATRDVTDWLKCDFMQAQVGSIFSGMISNVTNFGFFVRLDGLFIDGLVHVSTLDNHHYRFDPIGQRLIGELGGPVYRLGDIVKVCLESVHLEERKITFTLLTKKTLPKPLHTSSTMHHKKETAKNHKPKKKLILINKKQRSKTIK
ncbi:ribonuclease R [Candidatus Erwinia haradaeae]|uniref:Ribonuclease R n=1 Tax=Candidatus Erwinia haradaeae TaxID=1922217 RepID=A0A451D9J9_9GAMM|nr:ribonuclease R [Candidatus Erwinia haradaeae]VFP82853.1 Ribonuclease R [Candidatus Erwinia haradaeae]